MFYVICHVRSERSTRCLGIAAADQSRVPSACSMRGTSSKVKGLHCARHVQNSYANWSNESDFSWAKERGDKRNNPNSSRDIGLTATPFEKSPFDRARASIPLFCAAPASSPLFATTKASHRAH